MRAREIPSGEGRSGRVIRLREARTCNLAGWRIGRPGVAEYETLIGAAYPWDRTSVLRSSRKLLRLVLFLAPDSRRIIETVLLGLRRGNIDHHSCEKEACPKYRRGHRSLYRGGEVCSVNKVGISHVPYVRINDRSLRVTERLSRASPTPSPCVRRSLLLSLLPSLEVESAKPSRRNLRYPIDFPAGMLQHRERRGILLFN